MMERSISEIESEIEDLVCSIFCGDRDKAKFWMTTDNLNFGGCSPLKLIRSGRFKLVKEFVLNSIGEKNDQKKSK